MAFRTRIPSLLFALWAPLAAARTPPVATALTSTVTTASETAPKASQTPSAATAMPGASAPKQGPATSTTAPASGSGAEVASVTTAASTPRPDAAAPGASGGMPAAPDATRTKLPQGWYVTESAPQHYEAGVDESSPCEGTRSAYLRSRTQATDSFGTFMQAFSAQDFRGKRLRFSASVRHQDVKGWAGLWMRVEGADPKQPLAFDNMQSRALVGTHGCKRYDVVLDVPKEATTIMAGLIMSGAGKAWLGGVRFEAVDTSVKTTDLLTSPQPLPSGPQGLEEIPASSPVWSGGERLGRVGSYWFDALTVQTENPLKKGKGQQWQGTVGDELFEHGIEVNGTYRNYPLRVRVHAGGPTTRIQGTWGTGPVDIRLSPDVLYMRWGVFERKLLRDREADAEQGCNVYRQMEGVHEMDRIDVCGVALATRPPLTQLVVSFLANTFRRDPSPFTPPVPAPPVRSWQPDNSAGSNRPATKAR
ncbi:MULTISPECIES: AraC family transcriptional regulator [unclassified Corallococcus]|uniref:AraC family transcriptional regulator n=1 Tax=unclassified Corallococcus TaxID=2685029 RepID=UPI001A8DA38A|nr:MULTISPECIES: AraC family transcriptional regulator [unclassified Corallococcus]MBN9687720.1 AraC family transcriptional regulator [Corallococcus sp. NCSPR001]WAS88467.1 AraC family transcriptional regulator [Corallococcus sp. NCRR]